VKASKPALEGDANGGVMKPCSVTTSPELKPEPSKTTVSAWAAVTSASAARVAASL
jgi:hypothetical protein